MNTFASILIHPDKQKSSTQILGNGKIDSFFNPFIQPNLTINPPNDIYEQEADAMADKAMRMPDKGNNNAPTFFKPAPSLLQRKCAHCEEEEKKLQRKEQNALPVDGNATLDDYVANLNGKGQPLPHETRNFFGSRFGYDFSSVKAHTGAAAAQSAQSINALAYTTGNHIVFNSGQYAPQTDPGKRLLAHELTHVVQQKGRGGDEKYPSLQLQPSAKQLTHAELVKICYSDSDKKQSDSNVKHPESYPTYEGWIKTFTRLKTFHSHDTISNPDYEYLPFDVIGGTAGEKYGSKTATTKTQSVPVSGHFKSGEEFISHPTNQWVKNCLPENLRATAYQLPADCADIAVILRHVWLAAHHRIEKYRGWTIGDLHGKAEQKRIKKVIGGIYSGNVAAMVQPYADSSGKDLTDFNKIAPLLHPGDILVWEHIVTHHTKGKITSIHRTGGHTQTINNIERSNNKITKIEVLQGNQPIFSDDAVAIMKSKGIKNPDPESGEGRRLRYLPGRRIEADTAISLSNIIHPITGKEIWGADDGKDSQHPNEENMTIIIAAGPPKSAPRPSVGKGKKRSIINWISSVNNAHITTITGITEAILLEARSDAESNDISTTVTEANMILLGTKLGKRLKNLNRHNSQRLIQMENNIIPIISALQKDANNSKTVKPLFEAFQKAFTEAINPQEQIPKEQNKK